ncbi:hypothetical protein, partial [Arthrobacter sp. DR-2P]
AELGMAAGPAALRRHPIQERGRALGQGGPLPIRGTQVYPFDM